MLQIEERLLTALDHGPMKGARPSGITLHYTADNNVEIAIHTCAQTRFGYHYVIDRTGKVFRLLPDTRRTWHAGIATWNGHSPNESHLAVALVSWGLLTVDETDDAPIYMAWNGKHLPLSEVEWRPGNLEPTLHPWHAATTEQEAALLELTKNLVSQYAISPDNVCDHSECALPRKRKVDIGGTLSMTMHEFRQKLRGAST